MIKFLSYLGFLGSWYVSFLLASTLANTKTDYVVAFIFTSVMQFSSFYFFKKGNENQKYFYIAGVLFAISILGTMCYQLSIHDQAQNEMIVNSDEYQKHQDSLSNQKELIADMKASRESLILSYNEQVESLVSQKNSMPENYITRKAQVDTKINAVKQELSDKLEMLNNSLITQSNELKELNNTNIVTTNLRYTKGYLGISSIIADFFNINKELVVLFIQFVIAVTFEATAVVLHVSLNPLDIIENKKERVFKNAKIRKGVLDIHRSNRPRNDNTSSGEIMAIPNVDLKKKEISPKKIETKSYKISDIDVKKYRNAMEQTQSDTYCVGYRKISKIAGLTDSKGRQIFEHLKQIGIIETTQNGTKIIKFQKKVV